VSGGAVGFARVGYVIGAFQKNVGSSDVTDFVDGLTRQEMQLGWNQA
jgi:hypothetical protein